MRALVVAAALALPCVALPHAAIAQDAPLPEADALSGTQPPPAGSETADFFAKHGGAAPEQSAEPAGAAPSNIEEIVANTPDLALETNEDGAEEMIMLSDVLFEFGEARIRPDAEPTLREAAKALEGLDGVVIEGHTDDLGSEALNDALSRARAEAVRAWLVRQGLDPAAFEVVGSGEREPKVPNRDESGADMPENRALNRRVEFVLPKTP